MQLLGLSAFTTSFLCSLALVLAASGQAGAEDSEIDDGQLVQVWKMLEDCSWSRSQFSDEPTFLEIELLLSPYGRISISKRGRHGEWQILTWEVQGDPYDLIAEMMSRDPPPTNPCKQLPVSEQKIDEPSPALVSHIESFRKLPKPFEIEEVLRLHQPKSEFRIRTTFFGFQASWFGCDTSNAAQWAQKLANLLGTQLDPCRFPKENR
ncbi:MAG: hypothetical protein MI919_39860 [Holophagales bacterium]|nr:hypothetical protein [Holophagales bacterium]